MEGQKVIRMINGYIRLVPYVSVLNVYDRLKMTIETVNGHIKYRVKRNADWLKEYKITDEGIEPKKK